MELGNAMCLMRRPPCAPNFPKHDVGETYRSGVGSSCQFLPQLAPSPSFRPMAGFTTLIVCLTRHMLRNSCVRSPRDRLGASRRTKIIRNKTRTIIRRYCVRLGTDPVEVLAVCRTSRGSGLSAGPGRPINSRFDSEETLVMIRQ